MIQHNYRTRTAEATPIGLKPPAVGRLGELRIPVLAMIGDLDESSTRCAMALLAEKVQNGRLVRYAKTAHLISLERPASFFAKRRRSRRASPGRSNGARYACSAFVFHVACGNALRPRGGFWKGRRRQVINR